LAIDSNRKIFRKDRLARNVEVRIFALQRKAVVAVEAFSWNSPAKVLLILGTVEARAHRPVSGFLCVPAHWHLDESAVGSAVQIGSHMISGADDVVYLLFDNIGFLAVEPNFVTALVELAIPLQHRVVEPGGLVVEGVVSLIILDRVRQRWTMEGAVHAGCIKCLCDILVASHTNRRIYIARRGCFCRRRRMSESSGEKAAGRE